MMPDPWDGPGPSPADRSTPFTRFVGAVLYAAVVATVVVGLLMAGMFMGPFPGDTMLEVQQADACGFIAFLAGVGAIVAAVIQRARRRSVRLPVAFLIIAVSLVATSFSVS